MNVEGTVVFGLLSVYLLFSGLYLYSGRGAFLIAGYNRCTPEQKALFNEKKLCRFVGVVSMGTAGFMALIWLTFYFQWPKTGYALGAILLLWIIGAAFYMRFGKQIRKNGGA